MGIEKAKKYFFITTLIGSAMVVSYLVGQQIGIDETIKLVEKYEPSALERIPKAIRNDSR